MNYGDYLFEQEDEISLTDKLLLMDRALMQVHSENKFISSSLLDAYIIKDDTIIIVDACHAQNMR